jgi:acetyl esterase/lipase
MHSSMSWRRISPETIQSSAAAPAMRMKMLERRSRWPSRARASLIALAVSAVTIGSASAEVPENIASELRRMGPTIDPACTAKLYRPLMPGKDIASGDANPYPGVRVVRDQAFGPQPKDVVDIFAAEHGPASRPVLIFVPGGGGDKIEIQNTAANAFYDNIARWATRHGMIGVTMQRHASTSWDGGAKDVSAMIKWVRTNIPAYGGDPERIFIWAHSAANVPVGIYLGRPELHDAKGAGIKGAILMSPSPFNILPAHVPPPDFAAMRQMMASAGKFCGETGGIQATAGALPGRAAGQPGGPPLPQSGSPPGPSGSPPDPTIELARSSLPGLIKSGAKIMLANAELDPGVDMNVDGGLTAFNKALNDALCRADRAKCPTLLVARGHNHMSIVFSIDTADTSVSDAVLAFIERSR